MSILDKKYVKFGLAIIYILAIVLTFYSRYSKHNLNLPVGCDEFGYLQMAKAVSNGRLFENHAERPFAAELILYLKNSRYGYKDYSHLIAPHAYHLDAGKKKIINQYPPGTGLLLSLLPWDSRKVLAPALYAFLLALFLLIAFKIGNGQITFFHLNFLAVAAYFFYDVSPLKGQFSYISSVAPTYGILLAAGYLLEVRPALSILLLGLASVFRIANAIFLIPFLILYAGMPRRTPGVWNSVWRKTAKAVVLFLAGGFWIYVAYVWILLGNPLSSTYSYFDRAASLKNIFHNMSFYFFKQNQWFILHIILLILIVIMSAFWKRSRKWVGAALAIAGLNYVYLLIHTVTIDYYPYASSILLLGILLFQLEQRIKLTNIAKAISVIGTLILGASIIFLLTKFSKQDFKASLQNQLKEYRDCFSGYDVVWAELRSGTIEYATGKASFRYLWGPDKVRADVIRWLKSHHYKQAIWVSDMDVSSQARVEEFLKSVPEPYVVKASPEFGKIIEIE